MNREQLNQNAWSQLFKKYSVINEIKSRHFFEITAEKIKEFREPRLMTKFDHAYQLPSIFSENGISILPFRKGSYILGPFDIFHTLERITIPLKKIVATRHFETLNSDNITSETAAIHCAYASRILEDFLGEEITPTVSGRMGSNSFCFLITIAKKLTNLYNAQFKTEYENIKIPISVDRAQIEIDAGYESLQSFTLLEAKNHFCDDFVIRQLYYPYRKWTAAIKKPVRNLFLTYSNGIFELREYEFLRPCDYNSIQLVQCKKYAICNFQLNAQSVQRMLERVRPETEPIDIPFPQADSFDRVINLCELLANEGSLTKPEITENYGFDERQTDYYTNACRYLGLVDSDESRFVLTDIAKKIFKQDIQLRQELFIEQLLKRQVFKQALTLYFKQAAPPTEQQIISIMRSARLAKIHSESTFKRRASTVRAWIDWIVMQIED